MNSSVVKQPIPAQYRKLWEGIPDEYRDAVARLIYMDQISKAYDYPSSMRDLEEGPGDNDPGWGYINTSAQYDRQDMQECARQLGMVVV